MFYLPQVESVKIKNKNKVTFQTQRHLTCLFLYYNIYCLCVNTDSKHVEGDSMVCRVAYVSLIGFLYESHQNIVLALFTGLIKLINPQPKLGVFTEAVCNHRRVEVDLHS